MKLTQSEIEKAYDQILLYLEEKRDMPIESILNGINKYHKDRFNIINELKSKGLIKEHVSERESSFGVGLGNPPRIEREYSYSISDEGRELVRKGGFKKSRLKSTLIDSREWIGWLVALLMAVYQLNGCVNKTSEKQSSVQKTGAQEEQKEPVHLNTHADTSTTQQSLP